MINKAIIFCAPSGSGKTTIVKHMLSINNNLMFSVSACTRKQRANEVHGKDYYFLNIDTFKQKINEHQFLEYEEVYGGNYYGTLKSEIERIWDLGKTVIFDVDVEGGLNLKNYFGNMALAVFVKPPNIEELARRLRNRSTETDDMLRIRVGKAILELEYQSRFDEILVNDNLNDALVKAEQLVEGFLQKK